MIDANPARAAAHAEEATLPGTSRDALSARIERFRSDPRFQERLERTLAESREALELLAE